MNYRVTTGFLAAALALAALIFGAERFNIGPTATNEANATATASARQQPQIFQFDDTKVTALELHQPDTSVRVEKRSDTWVVAGTSEPANRSSFTSLIVRMSQLKATRVVDTTVTDLSQFGLDPPKIWAIAELDDGTHHELHLGIKTPVATGTYAKTSQGQTLFVVADQFAADLERLIGDPKEPATPTPRPVAPTPEVTPTAGP